MSDFLRLLRYNQWVKNFFVFLPILFTPQMWGVDELVIIFLAFIVLCLASSATYVLNDILDIKSDRMHPIKKYRPIAAGKISVRQGILVILAIMCLLVMLIAENNKYLFIFLYLLNTTIYSFFTKYYQLWDVFCLSLGFVLRTYFGAFVLELDLTNWFLLVTLSVSLFLACAKRLREFQLLGTKARVSLKDYSEETLQHMLVVSSSCTIIFYALAASTRGELLILSTAIVMVGIFRFHAVMTQSQDDSPTDLLLKDKQMYLIVFSWAILCAAGLAFGN